MSSEPQTTHFYMPAGDFVPVILIIIIIILTLARLNSVAQQKFIGLNRKRKIKN